MEGDPAQRLTVEITPLLEEHWTGIPVFTRRLIQALEGSGRLRLDFCVGLDRVPAAEVSRAIRQGTGIFLRERIRREAAEPIDAAVPILYPSVKPSAGVAMREASTIHDLSTLVMPETHSPANVSYHLDPLREQLLSDETVFCCSEATRVALLDAFPWVAGKARLLPQYVDWPPSFELIDRNLAPVALGRYAVVIGTIEPRKNLGLLLRALDRPGLAGSDLRFIVVGGRGWLVEQALAGLAPAMRDRVGFTGFVSEFMKYRLLRHAEFLVMPSLYEGFGIPALEAMSLGKPVLASRSSSFPEVIGEAGVFFDPYSVDEFVEGLAELSAPARLAELSPAAREQAGRFSAERMAAPVLDWLGIGA